MNDLIGFVMGNRQRERVMQVLGNKGPMNADKIAKVERIPLAGAKKVIQELEEKELLALEGENWRLTDVGSEVWKEMKRRA